MALIVPVAASVDTTQVVQAPVNSVQVGGVYFNFDKTTATALINYGNTDAAGAVTVLSTETWKLLGAYYQGKITQVTGGLPIAQELLTDVQAIVIELVGNAALKAQLLASGELVVIPTNMFRMLG